MSRLSDAAYEWLLKNAPQRQVKTEELWRGVQKAHPDITAITPTRKTPRTTLMRDIRRDRQQRFVIQNGLVSIRRG